GGNGMPQCEAHLQHCRASIAVEKRNNSEFALRPRLPVGETQLLRKRECFSPVALSQVGIDIKIGVAFHGETPKSEGLIALNKGISQKKRNLVRDDQRRTGSQLAAESSYFGVKRIAPISDRGEPRLGFCEEWFRLRPVL